VVDQIHGLYHDREDTLLHLSSIFSAKDDHLHTLEIDFHRSRRTHALCESVSWKLASIVDDEIGLSKFCQLLWCGSDQHVMLVMMISFQESKLEDKKTYHEERMVRSGTDDTNFDSVPWIPLTSHN